MVHSAAMVVREAADLTAFLSGAENPSRSASGLMEFLHYPCAPFQGPGSGCEMDGQIIHRQRASGIFAGAAFEPAKILRRLLAHPVR